jgi:hypothetical protein
MFHLWRESARAARSFSMPQHTSADAADTVNFMNFVPEPGTRDAQTPPFRVNFVNFATLLRAVGMTDQWSGQAGAHTNPSTP